MFQYAAGRALSYRLGVPLGIDNYNCTNFNVPPQLRHFNLKIEKIPKKLLPPRKRTNRLRWYFWKIGLRQPKIFYQGGLGYNPKIHYVNDDTYLIGFWQSELFFQDCKDVIKSDFEFITYPSTQNMETYQEINETKSSISLHIRRGDYLEEKHLSIFASCSQDYYKNAVLSIAERCHNSPRVFVFSDDPEWVKGNFKLPFPTKVISNNSSDNAIEDLRLMSACKHHVIANSSFSWWGAWLGKNKNKIIIAPKYWFSSPKYSNPDIYCNNWIRIKNLH